MHLFRHTSATESAKYMKESELKLMYGWQRESTSPSIYVHLPDDDVDKARLKHFGIIKEDTQEDLGLPPTCENCHQQCSSDNDWCDTCSRPITRKAQKEFDDVKEKDRKGKGREFRICFATFR